MTPDDALTRVRVREALNSVHAAGGMSLRDSLDVEAVLSDLCAALDDPARWCGVVGVVRQVDERPPLRLGDLVVTPHQEGA